MSLRSPLTPRCHPKLRCLRNVSVISRCLRDISLSPRYLAVPAMSPRYLDVSAMSPRYLDVSAAAHVARVAPRLTLLVSLRVSRRGFELYALVVVNAA